jgi:hypothetical protein
MFLQRPATVPFSFIADRISGSSMSIPTTERVHPHTETSATRRRRHFEDMRIAKINRLEDRTRLNASRIHLSCH